VRPPCGTLGCSIRSERTLRPVGELTGKVAIVTGAGRGLGRAHALALASGGASVVVNNRSPEIADAVVAEIHATGGRAVAHTGDVADWSTAEELVAAALAAFGALDVLVNNAGLTRDRMSFKMSEEEWDEVVRVNLKGHFAPVRFTAAHWRETGPAPGRRIVNTASEGGLFPAQGHANYAASKAGVVGLTLELAAELARYGATVNAVAMRARTRMTADVEMFAKPVSGPDPYDPAHAANLVRWLCSPDTDDVTGQVLLVVGRRIGVVGPQAVQGRVVLDHDWAASDLTAAKATLFEGAGPGLPAYADLS
jgi:NAD(P)-dependent dehydrogenase (short-subunit alcohol dehydrogenase family)